MTTIKDARTGETEQVVYEIVDAPQQHHEDLSPVSPQLIHIAEVVLGKWGPHFSAGFSELRGRAADRMRTDAYNILIEAERLVIKWVRDKDARCNWLKAATLPEWQPPSDRPNMARRGRPPKESYVPRSDSAQADIIDVEVVGVADATKSVKEE